MSKNKRFVLSDGGSINSNGYKVDINGLDLTRFKSNPVMLYEHNSKNVIGRWTDIKKEDHKLTAIPEFDMEDTEVLSIVGKVERGFLNGASVGIILKEAKEIDGVPVVTKSELFEASIVSVPADACAVRLYNENLETLTVDKLTLSIKQQKQVKDDFKDFYGQICIGLGLDKETEIESVLSAIKKFKTESEIEEAFNMGALSVSEYNYYNRQLKRGDTSVLSIIAEKLQEHQHITTDGMTKLYNDNSEKIITHLGLECWAEIKHLVKHGFPFARIKTLVDNIPERVKLSEMVKRGDSAHSVHDLDWYRKNNPNELQKNPELYQCLLKEYKRNNK